ncbi:MAG TPA: zinc metalloprotease HtpX [Terriglobales bacterium]|nr:zinc metalloprotease HtpX [Terriglobales bacterium]
MGAVPRDFYEIQKEQRAKSLTLVLAVIAFHFVAIGLVALAAVLTVGVFSGGGFLASSRFWGRFLLFVLAAATVAGVLHFLDAARNGPRYILKRLQAAAPDPGDRYHRQFLDTLDEMRIAAGLPRVNGYVLPTFAVNSMALIEDGGTPAVAMTEGLLAGGARDELQAAAAHELAHIARGDAVYLTLVCSLANVFERLREGLEPEAGEDGAGGRGADRAAGASAFPLYAAVSLSALVMRLLSTLVSRERELLADAAAVELCRSPDALGRVIVRAQAKNAFIGDFSAAYAPLFIVPPDARDVPDTLAGRVFNSHPPFMKRLGILAAMAHKEPRDIIEEVRESEVRRGQARVVVRPFEESREGRMELFPGLGSAADAAGAAPAERDGGNLCPRCRVPLAETFYEGVPVGVCPKCGGKLVPAAGVDRIVARREVAFSEDLVAKARAFREKATRNPLRRQRAEAAAGDGPGCPACGARMAPRPYNYQYFVPVEKCFGCSKVWFDADGLEILQILIEESGH